MADELKSCPFCGSAELGSFSVDDPEADESYEQVTCDGCDMMGPESLNRQQSAAKWNHRPEEDRLRTELQKVLQDEDSTRDECDRLRSALQAAERERDEARYCIQYNETMADRDLHAERARNAKLESEIKADNTLIAHHVKKREELEQERDSARLEAGRLAQELVELTGKLALAEVEVGRLKSDRDDWCKQYNASNEREDVAQEEIARLREALEFYGAPETWFTIMVEVLAKRGTTTDCSNVEIGGANVNTPGQRAREALSK